MFQIVQPVTEIVKTRRESPQEPTLTFTQSQWAALRNGMLAELLLQQDGSEPREMRAQWPAAHQGDFDQGRAMLRSLLTEAGWTL